MVVVVATLVNDLVAAVAAKVDTLVVEVVSVSDAGMEVI